MWFEMEIHNYDIVEHFPFMNQQKLQTMTTQRA